MVCSRFCGKLLTLMPLRPAATVLALCSVTLVFAADKEPKTALDSQRWTQQTAQGWYQKQPWLCGFSVGVWNGDKRLNDLAAAISDVTTFHCYGNSETLERRIVELDKIGRPLICTEWMNRDWGTVQSQLSVFAKHHVGCMHWGLVNGKTQTQYPWGSEAGAAEPKVWQHDIFRKDRTPYDPEEIEAFRQALAVAAAQEDQA